MDPGDKEIKYTATLHLKGQSYQEIDPLTVSEAKKLAEKVVIDVDNDKIVLWDSDGHRHLRILRSRVDKSIILTS